MVIDEDRDEYKGTQRTLTQGIKGIVEPVKGFTMPSSRNYREVGGVIIHDSVDIMSIGAQPQKARDESTTCTLYDNKSVKCVVLNVLKKQQLMEDNVSFADPAYYTPYTRRRMYFNMTSNITVTLMESSNNKIILPPKPLDMNSIMSYDSNSAAVIQDKDIYNTYLNHYDKLGNKIVIRDEISMSRKYVKEIISNYENGLYDDIKDWFLIGMIKVVKNHPDINIYNDSKNKITIIVDYIISYGECIKALEKENSKLFRIPGCDVYLVNPKHITHDFKLCPDLTNIDLELEGAISSLLNSENIRNGHWITCVNNNGSNRYYYNVANELHHVDSIKDPSKADGIWITKFKPFRGSNNKVTIEKEPSQVIAFSEADQYGFYLNEELANIAKARINSDSVLKLEMNKISMDKMQLEKDLLERDAILKNLKQQNEEKLLDLNLQHETQLKELKLKHEEESNNLDRDKHIVKNYYEERSYDRKDTSESLKILPTIVGGIIGVAGAIGVLSLRHGFIAAVAINPIANFAISFTVGFVSNYILYMKTGKEIFGHAWSLIKKVSAVAWDGVKSVTAMAWDGAKTVANAVVDFGRYAKDTVVSAAKWAGDVVMDCVSFVGDTISGTFDFIFG